MDLVTCTSLRASMVRAFSSWSAHHPLIYFHDVSFQCSQFPLGHPRSLLVKTLDGVRCSLAEIWVTSNSLSSRQADLAASATTRLVSHGSRRPFRATNGALALNRVLEAESATIGFNHSMCWYLDSTFCSTLHDWKRAAGHGNALLFSRMLIFMIWAAVSLESLLAFVRFWRRHRRAAAFEAAATMRQARGNGGEGSEGGGVGMDEDAAGLYAYTMHRLSHASTCCLAVRSMLVVTPLMLYWKVLLPCWECFDFEVAAGMLTGGRTRCFSKAAPCANVLSSIPGSSSPRDRAPFGAQPPRRCPAVGQEPATPRAVQLQRFLGKRGSHADGSGAGRRGSGGGGERDVRIYTAPEAYLHLTGRSRCTQRSLPEQLRRGGVRHTDATVPHDAAAHRTGPACGLCPTSDAGCSATVRTRKWRSDGEAAARREAVRKGACRALRPCCCHATRLHASKAR